MKKIKLIYLLILCSLIFNHKLFAQQSKIDSIQRLLKAEHKDLRLAFLNDLLARKYLDGNFDSLEKYAKRSLSFSQKTKCYEYQVDAWNTLGMGYRISGDYKHALENHFKAIKIAQTHKLENHYFYTTYSSLCLVYTEQGNYTPAIEYGYKTLHATEVDKDTMNMTIAHNNLANIFFQVQNYPKALLHYHKAFDIAVLFNNKYGQGLITSNIGSVYYQCGKLDSAKLYYEKSLIISREIEDVMGEGMTYANLGSYYQRKKIFTKAIECFTKAERIYIEQEMYSNQAELYYTLSDMFFEMNKLKEAKLYAQKSLQLAKQTEGLTQAEGAYLVLSRVYEKMNQPAEAYSCYKNYILYRDSISNDRNKEAQLKASFEYEYGKKQYSDSLDQVLFRKMQHDALEKEKLKTDSQRKITYIALIGCLIFFVLSVFIFKGYRDKQKSNRIIKQQKLEVENQKALVEEHQKETLDSITYARRIQYALLAKDIILNNNLENYFVLFKPKDIVSGDFYWATENSNKFYLAVCDSTGHGVPGAFMSLLNIGFLSEAIKEKGINEPNEVLNYVRERLISSIGIDGQKDGMDCILLCINKTTKEITYSAANNAPVQLTEGKIVELNKDRMPVGKGEKNDSFTLHQLNYNKGDKLYLYTDGYADQFGGPKGKKFKYKALNELLLKHSTLPMEEQRAKIETEFDNWKGDLEQVDDVCMIGIEL